MKTLLIGAIAVVVLAGAAPAHAKPTFGHCMKRANQLEARERSVLRAFCLMRHSAYLGE